jgi:altronate dehydratase large subunit
MLTGLAAAGCNLILFTTGRGAPQGFPFVPVVKVTGNERTFKNMNQHMDISVARVMDGSLSAEQAAGDLMKRLLAFASGEKTKAELCAYNNSMNIYVTGPVI